MGIVRCVVETAEVETAGLACEIPKRELWERGESKNPLRQNGNRLSPNERRSEVPVREAVPTRACTYTHLRVQDTGLHLLSRSLIELSYQYSLKFVLLSVFC